MEQNPYTLEQLNIMCDELKKIKNKIYRKKNTTETYTFNQIMDKYN